MQKKMKLKHQLAVINAITTANNTHIMKSNVVDIVKPKRTLLNLTHEQSQKRKYQFSQNGSNLTFHIPLQIIENTEKELLFTN